jgi:hypothetical protein
MAAEPDPLAMAHHYLTVASFIEAHTEGATAVIPAGINRDTAVALGLGWGLVAVAKAITDQRGELGPAGEAIAAALWSIADHLTGTTTHRA